MRMSKIIHILIQSLQDLWNDLWTTAVCNLLWLFSIVLIIPGPPATLALFSYGNRLAHGEVADIGDFFSALRRYWGAGWRWGFVALGVTFILIGDYFLTGRLGQSNTIRYVQGLYLAILAIWILIQLYTLPFMLEQEKPNVRIALRNAAVLLGGNLGFSILLGLLLVSLLLLGTLLFLISVAVGGVLVAVVGNRAVLDRLDRQRTLAEKNS